MSLIYSQLLATKMTTGRTDGRTEDDDDGTGWTARRMDGQRATATATDGWDGHKTTIRFTTLKYHKSMLDQ